MMTATTGIKCGNRAYHGADVVYHASTAEVRECYANTGRFNPAHVSAVAAAAAQGLQAKAALHEAEREQAARVAAEQERIRREAAAIRYAAWATIPVYGAHNRGYYALWNPETSSVDFYRVERPKSGKHAGRTFVKRQAGDNFDRMEWAEYSVVLDKIAQDPQTAGKRYGQQIGRCYRCHRTLTDERSRQMGIGPDCAQKEGLA
jgi:hypothetical protein